MDDTLMLDIFRRRSNGCTLWIADALSLDEARARVERLARVVPGEYLIYQRGRILVVNTTPALQAA
ncbi:MAG: hypothetical protein WAJ92_02925 [Candidatus Acidiferrales bacterium]